MTDTVASLKRKVRRLENKIEYLQAEADIYQMMAHDLAGEAVVATIKRAFPAIAKQWEEYAP